jgi:hypothetical protein
MTHRIEAWVIIDSRDGSRFGGLYESEQGAKASWWSFAKQPYHPSSSYYEFHKKKFDEQSVYILQPLVLIGDY